MLAIDTYGWMTLAVWALLAVALLTIWVLWRQHDSDK